MAAPGHVIDGEQHLADTEPVPGELLGVAVHEQPLAHRRGRLLGGQVTGAVGEAERGEAGGDRARGDQHHLGAAGADPGEGVHERADPARVDAAGGRGEEEDPTFTTTRAAPATSDRVVVLTPRRPPRPRPPPGRSTAVGDSSAVSAAAAPAPGSFSSQPKSSTRRS